MDKAFSREIAASTPMLCTIFCSFYF